MFIRIINNILMENKIKNYRGKNKICLSVIHFPKLSSIHGLSVKETLPKPK